MERYIDADSTIKAIRNRFNIYFEIPCDSDDRRVQEIIEIVIRTIKEQPTADVAPKSEVDQLQIELEAMRGAANSYKMHYENLAREIFAEIEKKIHSMHYNANTKRKTVKVEELKEQIDWVLHEVIPNMIADLAKKYMEEHE